MNRRKLLVLRVLPLVASVLAIPSVQAQTTSALREFSFSQAKGVGIAFALRRASEAKGQVYFRAAKKFGANPLGQARFGTSSDYTTLQLKPSALTGARLFWSTDNKHWFKWSKPLFQQATSPKPPLGAGNEPVLSVEVDQVFKDPKEEPIDVLVTSTSGLQNEKVRKVRFRARYNESSELPQDAELVIQLTSEYDPENVPKKNSGAAIFTFVRDNAVKIDEDIAGLSKKVELRFRPLAAEPYATGRYRQFIVYIRYSKMVAGEKKFFHWGNGYTYFGFGPED